MSTEMDSVKTYAETLAADLRTRAASVEKIGTFTKTELTVALTLQAVRNMASMLESTVDIAARLERLSEAERARAEAAERALATSLALNAYLREGK